MKQVLDPRALALSHLIRAAAAQDLTVVEHRDPVCDAERALDLVRHHNDRHAECVPELQDQLVDRGGRDRIEPGRGLVAEEQLGVEDDRTSERGALGHPARELCGHELVEPGQVHELELETRHDVHGRLVESRVLPERQLDVLGHGHGAE